MGRASQRHKMDIHGFNAAGDIAPFITSAISNASDANGVGIGAMDITGNFNGGNGGAVKYDARDVPPGIVFVDGIFTGTPTTVAVHTTSVFAITDVGISKPNTFTWTIT